MTGAVYNDISQFATLRLSAKQDPNAALEETASQFEALFIQMMLKSMRDATPESELFASDALDSYRQMGDQQLSLELAEQGGIGIARVLVEQMQRKGYVPGSGATTSVHAPPTNDAVKMNGLPITGIDTLKLQPHSVANTAIVDKRA